MKKASSLLITLMLVFGCITVSLGKSTLTISAASTDVKVGDTWYTVLSEILSLYNSNCRL